MDEVPMSYTWPKDVDYYYSLWSLASLLSILSVNHVFGNRVFEKICPPYRRLPPRRKLEWNCRASSTIHATLVTTLSLISLLFDTFQWVDPITSISRTGCIALSITIGYMLADTITMFTFQKGLELFLFCTHHLIVAACFTFLLVNRIAPIYGIIRLTSEISTPFLNQRWFYRTMGGENADRRAAKVTLVFAVFFIFGRYILPVPYWILFCRHFNSKPHLAIKHKLPSFTNHFISLPILLDVLNIAWGYPVCIVTKKALATLGYITSMPKHNGVVTQNGKVAYADHDE